MVNWKVAQTQEVMIQLMGIDEERKWKAESEKTESSA